MKTLSSKTLSSAMPALTDEETLEATINILSEHLPVKMEGSYTPRDIYYILLRAASQGDSIEHTVSLF